MSRLLPLAVLLAGTSVLLPAAAQTPMASTPSPRGAKVYIISPADGATVSSPVHVVFGVSGMDVAPAGTQKQNTGHHHLLIDTDIPKDTSLPLPSNEHIHHFGKGQTETSIELSPGKHTLQLEFADYAHRPFDPMVASKKITITVR